MTRSTEPVVALESVTRGYAGTPVLAGFSLSVSAAERIVLLGPSGCGKTTVLRLIAGFLAPERGRVVLAGETVSRDGRVLVPPERRNVGMVFQDLALWPHLTVRGNLEFGLKARGVPRRERERRMAAMLERMGLAGLAGRRPDALSGGQQQRVALARALVLEPRVLLMDEPLSSLDHDLAVRLRGEIVRLQEALGFTLIHVTHDRGEAAVLATRLVVMDGGKET